MVRALVMAGQCPKIPDDFDGDYGEIMTKCWSHNPEERPSFSQVVEYLGEHGRFKNVDYGVFDKYKEALDKADVTPGIRMETLLSSGKWRDISAFYVNVDDYEKDKVIGRGSYGRVFRAKHKQTNEYFALKELVYMPDKRIMYEREAWVMGNVRHPTLLELCGCTPVANPPQYILTRYMSNGSVGSMIKENGKQKRAEWDATRKHIVLYGTAYGMMYLHKHRVIHRDLKPDNVFLDDDLEPKIADFGLSKFVSAGQTYQQKTICGTNLFAAPELLSGSAYGFSVDVYAFGMFMFCVLSGGPPRELHAFCGKIIGGWRPEIPNSIPESYGSLIKACWDQDPNNRPTFHKVVEWLSQESFSGIDVESFKQYQEKIADLEKKMPSIPESTVNVQLNAHEPTPNIPKVEAQKHSSGLSAGGKFTPQPIDIKDMIMAEIEARQRRDVDFREFAEQECRTIKKEQPKVASKPLLQSLSNSKGHEKKQFKELSKRLNKTYSGSGKRAPKLNTEELPELYTFLKDNNALIDECYTEIMRMIYFTKRGNDSHHLTDLLRILRFITTAFSPRSELLVSAIYTQISRIAHECSGDIQELAQHCFLRFDAITRTKKCKMMFCRARKASIPSDVVAGKACFGVSLEEIFLFQTKRFPDLIVPKFLIDMVTKMQGLGVDRRKDLFEANDANFKACDRMISRLESGQENFMEEASLQDVMCLFRRWFRDLPVPILWKQEIESLKARSTDSEMLELVDNLPILSRYSLLYLVGFLQLLWKSESRTNVGISELSRLFMLDITGSSEKEPALSDHRFLECLIRNCDVSNIFPAGKV